MWRGSALSGLVHGALFFGLLFGLPAFPDIFDRRNQIADPGLPITVEIVGALPADPRRAVLAPDKSAAVAAGTASPDSRLPPLILGDRSAPDGIRPAARSGAAGTRAKPGEGGGQTIRLPTGKLETKPLQQAQSNRLDRDSRREKPPANRPARAADTATAVPPPAATKQAQTASRPSPDRTAATGTGSGVSPSPASERETSRDATLARTASEAVPAAARPRSPSEPRPARDDVDPTAGSPPPAAAARAQAARQASQQQAARDGRSAASAASDAQAQRTGVRTAAPQPAGQNGEAPPPAGTTGLSGARAPRPLLPPRPEDAVTPAAGTSAAVARDFAAAEPEATAKEFVNAVSGRQRDLVVRLLTEDRRLREAIVPPPVTSNLPEQARARTIERLQNAADDGFAHAQFNLASKYLQGRDVRRDPEQAQKWLTKAAEQGYAPAQMLVGLMRFTGVGLPRDLSETAFWWSLAADRGHEGAKLGSDLLQPFLKPIDVVKANRLRARWGRLINDLSETAESGNNLQEINRDLQDAAENGDIAAVLAMLAHGADADSTGKDGRNAVINAAWRGRKQIIRILLQRGAATELADDEDRTPLVWAAINGHSDVAAELLRSGANPNHRDSTGATPLIRAAWNGRTEVVRMLIEAGANLNIKDVNGQTALAHARNEGYAKIVAMLTEAGAR